MARFTKLRRVLANAALVAVSVLVALAMIEIILRARPTLLGQEFANGVLTRYTHEEGGIFYLDRGLHMKFMIPNLKTTMEYNGYTWTHETDAMGFRNRGLTPLADVVLLGDSFIYGHAVDFEGTVAHFLGEITGWRVANLGRQADCAFQEAYLLHAYAGVFRPRHVVYFYFENDVIDLASYLTPEQMRAFIETPLADIRYPERVDTAEALRKREREFRKRSFLSILERHAYVMRAQRWLRARSAGPPPDGMAAVATAVGHDDGRSLGWQYTRKAIAFMQHVARREGASLLVVSITYHSPHHVGVIRGIARDLELPFLDASVLRPDPTNWLPNHGQFSRTGARRLAELVADRLRATDGGPRPASR